jgi:hypothetical protein
MATSGSSYPTSNTGTSYLPPGVIPADQVYRESVHDNGSGGDLAASPDPSILSGLVVAMARAWRPIQLCIGGTAALRANAEDWIPREPEEDDDAYTRRIFHATLPPFTMRLASQAAGTILRKGIEIDAGDNQEWWDEWRLDVTGGGITLDQFIHNRLVSALLYGHASTLTDFDGSPPARTLAEERAMAKKPYLVAVDAPQVLGWRTLNGNPQGSLTQVRIDEVTIRPTDGGYFSDEAVRQIRVIEPGKYELWQEESGGWTVAKRGTTSLDVVPLSTIYSRQVATLCSTPPLLEVANLNVAYAQRFADYHHSIHVGAMPILVMKGYDDEGAKEVGLSVNNAILLPPDGDAFYVEPTSQSYAAQLQCLKALEEQISALGISTLAQQNLTNAAADAKRLDRVDSDSIMAVISHDLERAVQQSLNVVATYANIEPPLVTIPKDYENRLLDGNQITSYLQLYMQKAISQETLLGILQLGEVLPPALDIDEEIEKTQALLEEQMANEMVLSKAAAAVAPPGQKPPGAAGGVNTGSAADGDTKGSATLPTPLRPGKDKE